MLAMIHSFDVPELLQLDQNKPDRELMAIHNHLLGKYSGNEQAIMSINAMFRDIVETRLFTLFTNNEDLDIEKLKKIKLLAQFFSMTVLGHPNGVTHVHDFGETKFDIDYWLRFEFIRQNDANNQLEQLFARIFQLEILFKSQES